MDSLQIQFKRASELEDAQKWEPAYREFFSCAVKAKSLIANSSDSSLRQALAEIVNKATLQA